MQKRIIFGAAALVLVIAVVLGISFSKKGSLKPEEARSKVESFVNTYLMQAGSEAIVSSVTESYGMYKMKINIGSGQSVDSYVSKDGKLFFPQALDMDETANEASGGSANSNSGTPISQDIPKSDKPSVELFVMTHCPYGTQMEKGILPAIKALGDKVDFEIKFNDYAMHGEKELDESLAQYCIQKEQNNKFSEYLTCFLKSSDGASCLSSTGIDQNKMNSCIAKTDKEFSVKENFKNNKDFRGSYPGFNVYKDDNAKYGVGGSPTLIINGTEVSSGRDSASLLATICSAFEEAPEECSATISSATPAPGFGEGTTAASAAASCE